MSETRERRTRRKPSAPKSRWRQQVLVLLLSAGVVALVIWLAGDAAQKPKRDEQALNKRPARVPSRRKPGLQLAGRVQDTNGKPVKGATVFVLPKTRRGGVRDKLVHEVTDGEGRWGLRARSAFGCWIGVVAKGYLHVYLDGDLVDPSVQMLHILEAAPRLRVTLVDAAGARIGGKGVQIEPWPPSATFFLPGPGSRQGEQWAVSDDEGKLSVAVGSRGPVLLLPHVDGHHTRPPLTWLPQASGEIELRLFPNCSLDVVASAQESGAPLDDLVTLNFHDALTSRLVCAFTESPNASGTVDLEQRVPHGTYDLHIQAEGRAGVVRAGVVLPGNEGARTSIRVGLVRASPDVRLTLRLKGGAAVRRAGPRGARQRAPLTFLRREGSEWRKLGWVPGAPESWDPVTRTLVLDLPPARYQLLVADVVRGCAKLVDRVEIGSQASLQMTLDMEPGLAVPTTELRLGDGHAARVVARAAGTALPIYGHTRDRSVRVRSERDLLARAGEGRDILLGPYPVDSVDVVAKTWEGAQRTTKHSK